MKYGIDRRKELFALFAHANWGEDFEAPTDFDGVPSAQARRVWIFPYAKDRTPAMITTLWQVFHHARVGTLDNALFMKALAIPNTGYAKLTQCLFYAFPKNYFPIDSQTRPWLERQHINPPAGTSWNEYSRCLAEIKAKKDKPFYQLSYEAWASNQAESFNVQAATAYLSERFPNTKTGTTHIVAFRCPNGKELAFDPGKTPAATKKLKLFVSAPPSDPEQYQPIKKYAAGDGRNHHLKQHAPFLAAGHQSWSITINSLEKLTNFCDWYSGDFINESAAAAYQKSKEVMDKQPLNQILYGPPGTGKTYATTDISVSIADPEAYKAIMLELDEGLRRNALKARYDELVDKKRIAFTTFHQSFAYEDFIEGIRATSDEKTSALSYPIVDGVFKKMALDAAKSAGGGQQLGLSDTPRVWKISIDRRGPSDIRDRCFSNGEARVGWNDAGDLNLSYEERTEKEQHYWDELSTINQNTIEAFSDDMAIGDVVLCLKNKATIQAVGIITSDYFFDEDAYTNEERNYAHCRKISWLFTNLELNILPINDNKQLVQKTVYQLDRISWDDVLGLLNQKGYQLQVENGEKPNYVLIIDEINRGNIARIFGELITLLEPGKRSGSHDARKVNLPYSKQPFSVPANLYVIGTMNTADKSLAQLDLALRRRFSFIELPPSHELLSDLQVHGLAISHLLDTINQRIEVLLDRDHLIGHSYFYGLKALTTAEEREAELARVFSENIIPLLQEYFFDDHERIGWVLNDPAKSLGNQFVQQNQGRAVNELFTSAIAEQLSDRRYCINAEAFSKPEAYRGIVGVNASASDDASSDS